MIGFIVAGLIIGALARLLLGFVVAVLSAIALLAVAERGGLGHGPDRRRLDNDLRATRPPSFSRQGVEASRRVAARDGVRT